MGAGPRRLGTVSETRDLRFPTDRAGVLALGAGSAMPKEHPRNIGRRSSAIMLDQSSPVISWLS